jgi:hypothetical protein
MMMDLDDDGPLKMEEGEEDGTLTNGSGDDYVLPRPPSPTGLHRTFTPVDPDDYVLRGAPPSAYRATMPPTPSADHYPHRAAATAHQQQQQQQHHHHHHHLPPPHPASSPFPSSSSSLVRHACNRLGPFVAYASPLLLTFPPQPTPTTARRVAGAAARGS